MIQLVLAIFLGGAAFGSDQVPDVDMHAITREVLALQRYLFSEAEFLAPKNETAIRDTYPTLEKHLARLREKVFSDQPALRANVEMLSEQVEESDRAFRRGDKSYARYMLFGSLQSCVACHTRAAAADFSLPEPDLPGASLLDRAIYFFATRQFDKGREAYERLLRDANSSTEPGLVRSASLAIAIYYARVKIDPKGGAAYFSRMAGQKNFSAKQRRVFSAWAGAFRRWPPLKADEEAVSDRKAMELSRALLKKNAGSPADEIRDLRVSALLQNVLEAPGETSPLKAEALLKLGKIHERIDFPLYFRMGDLYLKACISDYKKSKAARDCYDALEAAVRNRVSQAAGGDTEIAELSTWRKLAY